MDKSLDKKTYISFLKQITYEIKVSQTKAITKVNTELIILYFNIGKLISQQQKELGWGAKVIDKLSHDIKTQFPQLGGFSTRNLKLMVNFYKEYNESKIGQPLVAQNENQNIIPSLVTQIPWTHNTILISKIKDKDIRYWYMAKIQEHGWSKNVLLHMIDGEVHNREGNITSNFKAILPSNSSDLVQQSFKDPYIFDFLTISEPFRENI